MKFGDKYELLESLTTGAVETFAANDKIRGERVLVHIVECSPPKPNQTTAEWALESFRQVAPDPVGPVLETGKYSGTLYAYLVTKSPDENAVKSWVRRYELQTQDTQESLTIPPPQPIAPIPSPSPAVRDQAPHIPGPMTQLLRDFESQSKVRTEAAPVKEIVLTAAKEPAPAPLPLPNLNMPGGSGLHAAPPWDPVSARQPATPRKEEPIGANSGIYSPQNYAVPPLPEDAPVKDASKPGEFTSFFQGPFRGDGPSDMPSVSSQPVEMPRKSVGDFTAVFGQISPAKPTPEPLESNGNQLPPSSFTGMFEGMGNSPPSVGSPMPGNVSSKGAVPPVAKENLNSPPSFATPSPAVVPNVPQPPIYVPPTVASTPFPSAPVAPPVNPRPAGPSSLAGDGATHAFARPSTEAAPIQPEIDPGPSSYTRIITPAKLRPSTDEANAGNTSMSGGSASPKIAAPEIPKIAPPPMPAPPKIAAPSAPKPPKVPTVDVPPPPSYWPLVLTLTALLFVAVLLVLYFLLRH